MTFVLEAAVVMGGFVVGRMLVRAFRARSAQAVPPAKEPEVDPFAGLPCTLGDVVTRVAERDDAWLAAALVFAEEAPIAALFIAPEAGPDRAVFARKAEPGALAWLSPLEGATSAREPPHVIEHDGVRFERVRRVPVAVKRVGAGAPSVGERAIVGEYAGPGVRRLVVVAGAEKVLAWVGDALGSGEFDVLPGGKATLED